MKDEKQEMDAKLRCQNCKVTWIISTLSFVIAISSVVFTAKFGSQLNEQEIRFGEKLETLQSLVASLGPKPNVDASMAPKTGAMTDVKSREKRSFYEDREHMEMIKNIQMSLNVLSHLHSNQRPQKPFCNQSVICVGRRGKRGKAGPRGPKGDQGERGLPGKKGLVGIAGQKGEKGDVGSKGAPGLSIDKAKISSKPSDVMVNQGSVATFFCEATGYPKPEITWLKNDKKVTGSERNLKIMDSTGLQIDNVSSSDGGTISCIADNVIGKDEASSKLIVSTNPVVKTTPKQVLATFGGIYAINCTATGFPSPAIVWKRLGGVMPQSSKIKADNRLVFQDIRREDSGTYSCTAKNSVGSAEATSIVFVQDALAKPKDCKEILSAGQKKNGIYVIWLADKTSLKVYCDMKTDGGGWTIFQRRINGSVDFYRGWEEYKNGFGDLNGNFWLGLDKINKLTTGIVSLRIELTDRLGLKGFAKYDRFRVESEQTSYKLKVSGYTGNAKDSLSYHNNRPFSTKDRNNGGYNCAVTYRGAWWYNHCHFSNLNGIHPSKGGTFKAKGISWYVWKKRHGTITFSEMKLRRVD